MTSISPGQAARPSRLGIRAITTAIKDGRLLRDGGTLLHVHVEPGVFDPDAVDILVAAFDVAWQSIKASGAHLSDKQIELTRPILAKYIVEQARRGERDQCRLRDGACSTWLSQI
jgi:hypothetical protein